MKRIAKVGLLAVALLGGCQREQRSFRLDPPLAAAESRIAVMPGGIGGAAPAAMASLADTYTGNAYQLSQGKRLFADFNCQGCHADGGGHAGPSFLDGWWAYGPDLVSIYTSISEGRPHGMPAFKDRLTAEQVWQLAGYVQKIGSYSKETAAPSRNDAMQSRPAENRAPAARPR